MHSNCGYFKTVWFHFDLVFQSYYTGVDVKYFSEVGLSGDRKRWWGSRQESAPRSLGLYPVQDKEKGKV